MAPDSTTVYVGTYTAKEPSRGERSRGIYRARLDRETGELALDGLAADMGNPTFIALSPDGSRLYALGEVGEYRGQAGGVISAFAVEGGELRLLNEQSSGGAGPAHISLDRSGRLLLVANYGGGSVASLPIDAEGRLQPPSQVIQHIGRGPVTERQDAPHAHCIIPDNDNRFALATDLGTDEIRVYRMDLDQQRLEPEPAFVMKAPQGAGPRHLAFSPGGRTLYVSAELSSEVLVYEYDRAKGSMHILQQISTLPVGWEGENTVSEVAVHPSGNFVFAGNRGNDSIAVFAVDSARTLLPGGFFSTGGSFPRHFAIDPGGRWLLVANQKSDNVVMYEVDTEFGELEPAGSEIRVPVPVCVKFA